MEALKMIRVLLIHLTVKILVADICHNVNTLDCEKQYTANESEDLCGTDGVWYHNFCYYAQAKCNDTTISIRNVGPCENNYTDSLGDINATQSTDLNLTAVTNETLDINTPMVFNGTTATITTTTAATTTTYDPIQHIFCHGVQVGSIKCTNELDPYCGTDDTFYLNNCSFEKAKCTDSTLAKQPLEMCKGEPPME